MVVNFAKIDLHKRPNFIVRNFDGTALAVLGHILKPAADIRYNEISEIKFEYPSHVNGFKLNEYDFLTGMRIIDVEGFGQFILHNPEEVDIGTKLIKTCSGYSLEYEFTNKSISLDEGTYNFWNPFAPDSTILGIILSEMPSWSLGTVSSRLIGKYRTFSVDGVSIYDFMKSNLEKTYECVFDFDTYNRKINVRSRYDTIPTKPVFISPTNLAKEIEVEEDLDDLFTVLDVNGADGVDIRSVNPMGENKIYNLDSYMNEKYFSPSIISKWGNWKAIFESYQMPYYSLVIAQNMQISRYATENAVLIDMQGELTGLESQKAALIQSVAMDSKLQSQLDSVNSKIRSKENDINSQKNLISQIQNQINSYTKQLKQINAITSFSSFFSTEEMKILDRYFKCGSLTDSSFFASSVDSYSTEASIVRDLSSAFNITDCAKIQKSVYANDITFYIINGGTINTANAKYKLSSDIINGTLQVNRDNSFIMSLYLNNGTLNNESFPSGTLSLTGKLYSDVSYSNTSLRISTSSTTAYMTYEVSEYQKMSIAWELFEYGKEVLDKKSSAVYHFSVDSSNFFAINEFVSFAREFTLGERIYLHLNMGVIEPIVTGVSIEFDDLTSLELEFASDFQVKNGKFSWLDNLDQSVSISKTLDFNQFNYSNFVNSGANTNIKKFMESALDTMKNMILSGTHNEITIDQAGLRCRKFDEASGGYSPKQIWMAHNALMFTNDNWNTATIGIGEFVDKNLGSLYGIVTPALVGTIIAGNNLIIESEKTDGSISVFKVDGEGASLHNASFNLYGASGGRIDLGATLGIVAGPNKNNLFVYNSKGQPTGVKTVNGKFVTSISAISSNDEPNASFWLDMNGSAFFKGKILAKSGEIGGWTIADSYLYSGSGNNRVSLNGGTDVYSQYAMWAGAENPANAKFWVKKNGEMCAKNGIFSGKLEAATGSFSGKLEAATGTFSGELNAASGTFKGTVQASKYLDSSGRDMMSNGKFTSDYLDVRGLNVNNRFIVDSNGNVTIRGGSISWGAVTGTDEIDNRINNAQNSADRAQDAADDAYDAAYNADKAAQDAADLARKIANGTYRGGTFIDGTNIYSPNIYSNNFSVIPTDEGRSDGSFNLYGYDGRYLYHAFQIKYNAINAEVEFWSPAYAYAYWMFERTAFSGYVDFSDATVLGLDATAKFG